MPIFIAPLLLLSAAQAPSLRSLAQAIHLNLGSCVAVDLLKSDADQGQYASTLASQVTMVEPENELKPPSLWKGIGMYDFSNSDYLLGEPGKKGWVAEHSLKLRGHVLLYARDDGYTIPRWLLDQEKEITPEQAKTILHDYITAVAGRYKGKIAMWDVVNEAIDDKPNDNPFHLRNSFWFRKLGPEFLVLAFKYAHEADPKAELYYNEFGVEGGGPKTEALLELVDYLKKEKAPITGVGLQYHTWLSDHVAPGDGHYKLLDAISQRKLTFMITELDLGIDVKPFPMNDPQHGLVPANPEDLDRQAENFANIFTMGLSYKNCHGIQMWGITDRHSWISRFQRNKGCALIFDGNYQPKPAYKSIAEVLAQKK